MNPTKGGGRRVALLYLQVGVRATRDFYRGKTTQQGLGLAAAPRDCVIPFKGSGLVWEGGWQSVVGFGFFFLLRLFSRCVVVTHTKLYISLAFKTTDGEQGHFSFFFFLPDGGGVGSVREQIGPISLYMLVGGGWRRTGASFAFRGLLACFLPFLPAARGDERVCGFLVRDGRTDWGADAKDERRRPAGKQRDEMYCFSSLGSRPVDAFLSGHPLVRSTQQQRFSQGGGGSTKKGKGQRDIYTCRCVFALRLRGNSCQISRYLGDIYTWKLQPT